ncbi:uncharacterized protein LOC110831795 [Zootermopsis nevadensis]|uniref:uncharacterized protein LOC110831795 n=1 Tax=Zootermopsis nevadensis TaxID=136037 RepID=UPI000B8EC477|nr:uncharacterized protein LOC110831795 [Zootermopsis nevadensis]
MAVKLLFLLTACLAGATTEVTQDYCDYVCSDPRQVLCPGPKTADDCAADQIFKVNGSLCACCNACITIVGANGHCLNVPSKGLYYQCQDGYTCSYRRYCVED